jgi:ribosomal protein S18 acetylase RimI-like enzyme
VVTILVRDARVSEYEAAGDLVADAYTEFIVHSEYLAMVRDVAARAAMPGNEILVALDDGELVGTATFVRPGSEMLDALPPGIESTDARHGGMRMMAVAGSARNRGVGRALVEECTARTRLAGFDEVAFVTADVMTAARAMYEGMGFTRAPERDKRIEPDMVHPAYVRSVRPWPEIREARPDDFAAAGELTASAYIADGFVSADDAYVDELRDAASRAAEAQLLVAVDRTSGAVVGTVTTCPDGSPFREIARDDEGEFRMLAVAKSARGNGIGEALVRTVLARSCAAGNHGVAMSSAAKMHTAHRLYERLGFTRDPSRDWDPVPGVALKAFAREV